MQRFVVTKNWADDLRGFSVVTDCQFYDVKFHEIFCLEIFHEIFHEIFLKYLKKITMFFFRLYTHPFNVFYTSNITFHSFMHTAAR